jgi:hypothetical protein
VLGTYKFWAEEVRLEKKKAVIRNRGINSFFMCFIGIKIYFLCPTLFY